MFDYGGIPSRYAKSKPLYDIAIRFVGFIDQANFSLDKIELESLNRKLKKMK